MEFDAWELIALLLCYFIFSWGFRLMFWGTVAKLIGGVISGKSNKVEKPENGKKSKSATNGNANKENITSDSYPA